MHKYAYPRQFSIQRTSGVHNINGFDSKLNANIPLGKHYVVRDLKPTRPKNFGDLVNSMRDNPMQYVMDVYSNYVIKSITEDQSKAKLFSRKDADLVIAANPSTPEWHRMP